jgi:hypothetical protein
MNGEKRKVSCTTRALSIMENANLRSTGCAVLEFNERHDFTDEMMR